tara:strand:- start:298 stop:780 length:483 start_codon:yes stop_codon:yes gene_type:complete
MAFVGIGKNTLHIQKAALTQADYDTYNLNPEKYNKVEISDADFTGFINTKRVVDTITADSVTFKDNDYKVFVNDTDKEDHFITEQELKNLIAGDIEEAKEFLVWAPGKPHREYWVAKHEEHINTLENFDTSTVSYPNKKHLYELLYDAGLPFINYTYQSI